MTPLTQPTRPEVLTGPIDNDTHLESTLGDDRDEIDPALASRTRVTSQGHLVASLAYTRRFRLWRQSQEPVTTDPPLAALGLGQP